MGLAALAVAGCSFDPVSFQPPSGTPTPTETVDPVRTVDSQYFLRGRDGAPKSLSEGTRNVQAVATPHLAFTLEEWFVGSQLSLDTTAQLGESTPLRAPQGYELVAFTVKGGIPAFIETNEYPVASQLRVGDKYVPVPNLFDRFNGNTLSYLKQWEMFVLCVQEGQPVVLEIADEGRTVQLDLREGVPVVDDAWRATTGFRELQRISCTPDNGVFRREFTTLAPEGYEAATGSLSVGLQPDFSNGLMPWTPTLGWAPDGHQWLPVPMNVRIGVDGDIFPQMTIDVANSFQYQDESGAQHAAVHPTDVSTDALARNQVELIVFWPVSGRDATAQLSFSAVGEIVVNYTDYPNMPAQFTSEAVPLQFTLTFDRDG